MVRWLTRGHFRRRAALWAVFKFMPRFVRQRVLERERAVVEWRITGRSDGRHDVRQLVIEEGAAAVLRGEAREADLTVTVTSTNLLLLAGGDADGAALFVRGELEIEGDPWLAMRLPRFFGRRPRRWPRRRRARGA